MTEYLNADAIKAELIDFIVINIIINDCLFANELFYRSKERQSDLITINGYSTAFEMKSSKDQE